MPIDVIEAVDKRVKTSREEIHKAIKGKLAICERRLLKTLLTKIDQVQKEIEEILVIMQEVAQPYQAAVAQLDSILNRRSKICFCGLVRLFSTQSNGKRCIFYVQK